MWRPCREEGHVGKDHAGVRCDEHHTYADSSCFRQLWIWIHASAFDEGFSALKFACEKQVHRLLMPDTLVKGWYLNSKLSWLSDE